MSFREDIENAKRRLYSYIEMIKIPTDYWNKIEKDFLNGFEFGWEYVEERIRQARARPGIEVPRNIDWGGHINALRQKEIYDINKFLWYKFGEALGVLMAALELDYVDFMSLRIRGRRLFDFFLGALEDKPQFRAMIDDKERSRR